MKTKEAKWLLEPGERMVRAESQKLIASLVSTPAPCAPGIIGRQPFQHVTLQINICVDVAEEKGRVNESPIVLLAAHC